MASTPRQDRRLAWSGAAVQVAAVSFHAAWHAVGGSGPAGPLSHYLLLHAPLHLGVAMLAVAVVRLRRRGHRSLPLRLVSIGVLVQVAAVILDLLALLTGRSPALASTPFIAGGVLALCGAMLVGCARPGARRRAATTG